MVNREVRKGQVVELISDLLFRGWALSDDDKDGHEGIAMTADEIVKLFEEDEIFG